MYVTEACSHSHRELTLAFTWQLQLVCISHKSENANRSMDRKICWLQCSMMPEVCAADLSAVCLRLWRPPLWGFSRGLLLQRLWRRRCLQLQCCLRPPRGGAARSLRWPLEPWHCGAHPAPPRPYQGAPKRANFMGPYARSHLSISDKANVPHMCYIYWQEF